MHPALYMTHALGLSAFADWMAMTYSFTRRLLVLVLLSRLTATVGCRRQPIDVDAGQARAEADGASSALGSAASTHLATLYSAVASRFRRQKDMCVWVE